MSDRVTLPGQKQSTVSAWLVTAEAPRQVLLLQHRKLGVWLQPGGHVEELEDPWEAAIREVMEETGLDISSYKQSQLADEQTWDLPRPDFLQLQTIPPHGTDPLHYHVDHQFVITLPRAEVRQQEAESGGIGWFTLAETVELALFENTRVRLAQLLTALPGDPEAA